MEFYWVFNSLRRIRQSAAQGLLFAAVKSLRSQIKDSQHVLVVTNERRDFFISHLDEAKELISLWCREFRIPLESTDELFSSIILFDEDFEQDFRGLMRRIASGKENIMSARRSRYFVFNGAYPSENFFQSLAASKSRTIFLSMAPTAALDSRYDLVSCSQVETLTRVQLEQRVLRLIPARYPYLSGQRSDGRIRNQAKGVFSIFTTGENVLLRLHPKDFREVIFPILERHPNTLWTLVGVTEEQLQSVERQNIELISLISGWVDRGRIRLHAPLSNGFLKFLATEADLLYKGSHAGGATTVAGCINSGIPVVDMNFADSRAFLPDRLSAPDRHHARELISNLILSGDNYDNLLREQSACLVWNNEGNWSTELRAALKEMEDDAVYFDRRYPRSLRLN